MPTIFRTERPDVAALKMLEGKVVIIVDGYPNIMSVPAPIECFIMLFTKKAVWIALILYSLLSLIEQSIYLYLFNKYPEDSIVTYLPKIYWIYTRSSI